MRLLLALVNRQANDDHLTVIKRLMEGLPVEPYSCWECFQPKFYYEIIIKLVNFFSIHSTESIAILAQIVNTLAGIGTLYIIWLFLGEQKLSSNIKNLIFAFFAFNPDLIGTNIQVTNDSFIIFFGTIAIYALWKFIKTNNYNFYILIIINTILAAITKVSGVVLFVSIISCLIIQLIIIRKQSNIFKYNCIGLSVYIFLLIMSLLLFSPYMHYYQKLHNPFVTNIPLAPHPQFLKQTTYYRPGITSIVQGYLSFNFFSIIREPFNTNGYYNYPKHRTSLLSEIYARFYSIHFPQWPPSWQDKSSIMINLTRIIFFLALLPTGYIFIGFISVLKNIINQVVKKGKAKNLDNTLWIFPVVFLFMFASLINYTYTYRDFGGLKALYLYPAILSIVFFFIKGVQQFENRSIVYFSNIILVVFIFLELIDTSLLFIHLLS